MQSMYTNNDDYQLDVKDWVWLNEDKYSRFSFDSEAEREWIHTLINESRDNIKEIRGTLMVGKNFLPNSEIRYQYYDDGLHYSYPDFILENKRNEFFIFEVKSLNHSSKLSIDEKTYQEKIRNLMEFYKHLSNVLPDYYFCFPIKKGDTWNITYYKSGVSHEKLSLSQFASII